MTARLLARIERLRPHRSGSFVVFRDPGESDLDVKLRALAVGRPVVVAPRPCKTSEEWLLTYAPLRSTA